MATTQLPHSAPGTAVVPMGTPTPMIAAGETSSSAIAAREKAAVEARFLVALHRPRDFDTCRLRIMKACQRPRFAEVARYTKPVGNQKVTGLSVRFAEEAATLWSNISVSALLVFDDDERRIYRVEAIDLETNRNAAMDVMVEKFVERRQVRDGMEVMGSRTNTSGQIVYKVRATEDDLTVKVNANLAKARRNVILELLPADVKEEAEEAIIATMADRDRKDPDGARKAVSEAFFKMGVMPSQLGELLGHPLEQVTPAELTLLRSYYTALKDGEATWAEIVESHTGGKKPAADGAAPASGKGSDALAATLNRKKNGAKASEPSAPTSHAAPAPAQSPSTPGTVCEACGAADGAHKPACPYSTEA